jgi:hypothetical protein
LLHLRKADHSNFVREAAGRGLPCDGIRLEYAELVMSSIEAGDADCRGELKNECLREVEQFVALAAKSGAEPGRRAVLRGRLIAAQNGEPAALRYVLEHCSASEEYLVCARYQLQLAAKNSSENEFRKLVNAYITMACDEQPRCAPAHRFVGDLFAARSDLSDALTHLEISAKTGGGAEGWRRYAQVAHQAGVHGRAEDAVKRARTDDGNTADPGSMQP